MTFAIICNHSRVAFTIIFKSNGMDVCNYYICDLIVRGALPFCYHRDDDGDDYDHLHSTTTSIPIERRENCGFNQIEFTGSFHLHHLLKQQPVSLSVGRSVN